VRGALVALSLLSGALVSSAVGVIDAPAASAHQPIPCLQTPDGKACTQGADGTGGGNGRTFVSDSEVEYQDFQGMIVDYDPSQWDSIADFQIAVDTYWDMHSAWNASCTFSDWDCHSNFDYHNGYVIFRAVKH
jgi:hypothetical protein